MPDLLDGAPSGGYPQTVSKPCYRSYALARRDDLGAGYHLLHFATEQPLETASGQFAMVRMEGWGQAPLLSRPMSLLTGGREPSILIKAIGEGTRRMAAAQPGSQFEILGPLGKPWRLPEDNEVALLVAGGVGVAPIISLAEQLVVAEKKSGRPPMRILFGGRSAAELPLLDRLAQVVDVGITTEDGSKGFEGRVTALLERELEELKKAGKPARIYACGPHAMMAAVAGLAEGRQNVACEVSLEAPMACGFGVCLGCPVARPDGGYLYTCVEGPCVNAREVDWKREVF